MLLQVLGNEAPMAVMRFFFTTQEATIGDGIAIQGFLDATLSHRVAEPQLVFLPRYSPLLVSIEKVLRRRQLREMEVAHSTNLF